jgi:glycosyltransferase involved in cell wall biosynthesis
VRLLWISHRAGLGGAELGLAEGAKVLAQRGHDIHVVLPREGPLRQRLEQWSAVHLCHHNPWVGEQVTAPTLVRWAAYDARRAIPELTRLARRVRPDVIATNTITVAVGGIVAKRVRAPHVWFIREFGSRDHGMRFFLGRRATFFLVDHTSELIVVTSEALRRYCAALVPRDRIRLVTPAVEIPDDVVRRQPGHGTPFRLILVGAKAPSKGQLEAVDAAAEVVSAGLDVRLDLVGSGRRDYEERLAAQLRSLKLDDRVRVLDFSADALSLVADSDVALMCSRSEAFGRVTVEAMKLGKPVIGTAAGATPELILPARTGLVYQPGDVEDLAACISELYHDRALAQEMGARGQRWASEQFNMERYGDQLEAVLDAARA